MQVFINGKSVQCAENCVLSDVLNEQNISTDNIAIAIDEAIVFRKNWDATVLTDGCDILIIKATQGG